MTELSPQAFPSQIQLRSRLKGMRNGYATEHLPALTLMFPGANRGKNIYSQWVWWRWRGLCRILLCRLQTQGRETVCRSYSLPGTFLTAREECKIHQKL